MTHGYHRYPAKFIPQIVHRLINEYTEIGDTVLDPFGGCGTTLVEAKILGRKSIGFDINPIAKLITQTKITPIKPVTLNNALKKFNKIHSNLTAKRAEHHQRIDYWFEEKNIAELDRIYSAIQQLGNNNVRRFFLCSFSHNLKNCSRWLMKSIKPTLDKNKSIPEPLPLFLRHLSMMMRRNEQFYMALNDVNNMDVPAQMLRRNAAKKWRLPSNSIDLIVTSPPYVTSYEYADLHQLSLLWFGDDPKRFKKWNRFSEDFDNFRKTFVGTSIKRRRHRKGLQSTLADNIINKLLDLDVSEARSRAVDVGHYYQDMGRTFQEMYRVLRPGAKACIIIGNTRIHGVDILNAEVAAEQMCQLGFHPVEFVKREITNKMIAPWRDTETGKFTDLHNPDKQRAYEYEYVLVMQK